MNNYADAYRNYYSRIRTQVNPHGKSYGGASIEELLYKNNKKKQIRIVDTLVKQVIGSIVLLVLAFTIKMTPTKEAQAIYAYSKEVVKTDFNYKSFISYLESFNILDYIRKIDTSL